MSNKKNGGQVTELRKQRTRKQEQIIKDLDLGPCKFCGHPSPEIRFRSDLNTNFFYCGGCSALTYFAESPNGQQSVLAFNRTPKSDG
jgi:hypothetical protein